MRHFFLSIVFLCGISLISPVFASPSTKNDDIAKVEVYLQQLRTIKARFIQTASDGSKTSGVFYLQRPGKMRFEYDQPIDDFIVADGTFIYFYDAEMEQQSSISIGETLADFILREKIALSGDVSVTEVKNKKDNTLHVTLTQTVDPNAGALTLIFDKNPMRLRKWFVYDAQGLTTQIALWEIETDVVFKDKKLFIYLDPNKTKDFYND